MNPTLAIIIAIGVVVFSVFLFIFTFVLNKRTPKPEGCENLGSECEGCQMTSCSHYKEKKENEENGKEE